MAEITAQNHESGHNKSHPSNPGLPREMGFFAVLVFGVACISLTSSGLLPFSTLIGRWPSSDIALILTVAVGLCLFSAYTYSVIGCIAPKPGADYVVASQTLNRPLAFASSWTLVIFSSLVAGALIAVIPQTILPMFSRIFSMVGAPAETMISLAKSVNTPESIAIIGTVLVVLTFLMLMLPARTIVLSLQVGLGLGILAWGIIYFQLATAPVQGFQVAWNNAIGEGTFLEHLVKARALGMDPQAGANTLALAGILLSFWVFYGYIIPTYFAGDVKRPEKNLIAGSLSALAITWGIFIGASLLLLRLVPAEWLAAESFLAQSKGFDGLAMPWIPFYAAIFHPNIILTLLVFIGWFYTLINLGQTYFYYCSRILLAWVDDGLIPNLAGYIHPGLRSPIISVLLVAIVAEFGVLYVALSGPVTPQVNFVFFLACTQLIPVLSVTLFPFLKPAWFESSNRYVRLKIGPVPVISLAGLVTFVYLVGFITVSIVYPVLGGVSLETLAGFAVIFISGLLWYLGRVMYLKSRQPVPVVGEFSVKP